MLGLQCKARRFSPPNGLKLSRKAPFNNAFDQTTLVSRRLTPSGASVKTTLVGPCRIQL
jgi:hypothetical protein